MNILLLTLSAVAVVSGLALVAAYKRAVAGYEDELGFHAGAQPVPATSATAGALRATKVRAGHRRSMTL